MISNVMSALATGFFQQMYLPDFHATVSYAVPSYIGQGTNAYTTSQLARYATAIATSGNVYDLTLLDRQTDYKHFHW